MSGIASDLGSATNPQLIFILIPVLFVAGGIMLLALFIHLSRPRFPARHKIIPIDRDICELWARQVHCRRSLDQDREAA